MMEPLRAEEITARLKTKRLGKNVHVFQEIGSTNSKAMQMAAKGAEEGTLLIAETQTGGKGRLGRKWFSPSGVNLYLSLILRPPIDCAQATILTLLAGIAVAQAIRERSDLTADLKWPNDVLIGEKKVAGILAELAADGQVIKHLVLGIGLNVNSEASMFSPELSKTATSLKIESGQTMSRLEMLETLVNQLERWYTVFLDQGPTPILKEYSRLSRTLGRQIQVVCHDKVLKGEAVGLAPNGGIVLREENGTTITILTGDVIHLR
jgi:BirA family transcriptional regulator, biotin operon repressor / biotin---[acetyl-CoA-carboxylase] ligase